MDNNSVIIPFCLYGNKKLNKLTISRKTDTGKFICPKKIDDWVLVSTFNAVNPMMRPIPEGMNLFCAEISNKPPYETVSIEIIYNPFDIKRKGTYFIAYTTVNPNTIPLYFDKIKKGFYVSLKPLDISIKQDSSLYTQNISPIFVFPPNSENIKFICNNGNCIPFTREKDIFNTDKKGKPMNLTECSVSCSILKPVEEGGGKPRNLESILKTYDTKNRKIGQKIKRVFKKTPPWVFLILMLLLVVFISLIVYLSFY